MSETPLDIIVGGAGDRLFRCAKRYANDYAARYPDRRVIYLPQGKRRTLARLIAASNRPNLIGHSWGAADVSWAAQRADKPLGLVIGIDGVGKPGPWRPGPIEATAILSVRGVGSEGRISDGNLTAWMGRGIGHAFPEVFKAPEAIRFNAPFAHYAMTAMMRHPGEDGRSAEDWLLGATATG